MFLPVHHGNLFPVAFFPTGGLINILDVLAQLVPGLLVPVGNADHLVDIVSLAADGFLHNHPVLHPQDPVIGTLFFDAQEIGAVVIGPDDPGIGKQQVRLEHVGVGEQIPRHQGRRNVVGLVEQRIFQKFDHRILVEQLVKQLRKIAPDHVDFVDSGRQARVNQPVDDPYAVDTNQGLGCVEGNRHKAGAEARRDENGALHAIGFQGTLTGRGYGAGADKAKLRQFFKGFVHRAQGTAGRVGKTALGQGG